MSIRTTIRAIRSLNLRKILNDKFNGEIQALSDAIGRKYAQVHPMLFADKSFGDKIARDIEEKLGLEQFFLDIQQETDSPLNYPIELIDIEVSAGSNGSLVINESVIKTIPIALDIISEYISSDIANCQWVKVRGDCMEPELFDNDLILIDKSDTNVKSGEIYVFSYGDEIMVKRIFIQGVNYLVQPKNINTPAFTITPRDKEINKLRVIGRKIWRMGR